ncbi:Hypothetical protein NocV09_01800480 [Nannochloropsis oceanica]
MLARAVQVAVRCRGGAVAALRNGSIPAVVATAPIRCLASTPVTETDEYIIFPREAPGLDYKLNWSLNGDDVTPAGNAYRNLDASQLKGKKAGKEGGKEVKLLEAGDTVPFETFDAHLADVKATLEKATDLYVEDGSSKGGAFNVRVIADSPAYALAAKALLEQAQTRSSSWPFTKSVVVYAAGGAKAFAGVMFSGGKAGEVTGATVALGGVPATAIKSAMSLVAEAMKK